MAGIFEVAEIIEKMTSGFEEAAMSLLEANGDTAVNAVREQLWSGLSGDDSQLTPTYDDDPYFEEPGFWHHRNKAYKEWKAQKTPPSSGPMLRLPPRPDHVPNLYIDGTFHNSILSYRTGDSLTIISTADKNDDMIRKWGKNIYRLGSVAVKHINRRILEPGIWRFFENCGW